MPNLKPHEKKSLIAQTIEQRNEDRGKELSIFLDLWPFLKLEKGLRDEFKMIREVKTLNYLNKRLLRKLPSNN